LGIKRYTAYLKYVLRHKWFVSIECFKRGIIWRGLLHDLSKFRPSEFIPYAKYFYGPKGENLQAQRRDKTGYYKPTDTGDEAFDWAWLLHQKRNKHHWQYWILPTDNEGVKILPIDYEYIVEMVNDWVGAGKAQGYFSPKDQPMQETIKWYDKNKDKMQLHPESRKQIEQLIKEWS
jgi:hypothetical protein